MHKAGVQTPSCFLTDGVHEYDPGHRRLMCSDSIERPRLSVDRTEWSVVVHSGYGVLAYKIVPVDLESILYNTYASKIMDSQD